jgi:signal transduction histidine kinase
MRRPGPFFIPALWMLAAGSPLQAGTGNSSWARLFSSELRGVEQRRAEIARELETLPEARFRPGSLPVGFRSQPAPTEDAEKAVLVDLGREYPVDDIVLVPAWFRFGDFPGPGFGFPVRFRVELSSDEAFSAPATAADFTAEDFANPGLAPVSIHVGGKSARFVRVTATKLWRRIDDYVFALGELLVVSGNRNRAFRHRTSATDSFESPGMWSRGFLTDDLSVLGNPTDAQMLPTNGHHSAERRDSTAPHWVQVDLGRAMSVEEIRLVPARPIDYPDTIGFGFPPRFRLEGSLTEDFRSPVMFADHTNHDFPNPGDKPVVISGDGTAVRYVRLTTTELWPRDDTTWAMALAEMQVMSRGTNVAIGQPVTASDTVEHHERWQPRFLVDDIAPKPGMGNITDWLAALARRQSLETELAALESRRAASLAQAETRLLWTAGGLVCAAAGASVLLYLRARRKHRREARRLREDIAQDLHDEIGSNLGSIAILSQLAIDSAPNGEAMRHEVEEIHRVARETTESMRDIVWLISPGKKTTDDLAGRLHGGAASLLAGVGWNWSVDGLRGTLSLDAQRDVLLILKEALHNIRKHSGARRVDVRLCESDGHFRMEIGDDGCGFDPANATGCGLANMQRRAQRIGGKLDVDSVPGRGTRLTLTLPLS